jgi:hypothetical protein
LSLGKITLQKFSVSASPKYPWVRFPSAVAADGELALVSHQGFTPIVMSVPMRHYDIQAAVSI